MRLAKFLPWLLLLAAGMAKAELACGDLLAGLGQKPDYLEYQGCEREVGLQDRPLVARYRVAGRHAHKAERYLQRLYGLPELKRYCCAWDSTLHSWRDRRTGVAYMLVMASGETLVRRRADWPQIAFFEVSLKAYAHDP